MKKTTIMIVDDHQLIRETLAMVLGSSEELQIVADTGDSEKAINLFAFLKPDIVFLDINIKPLNGFDTVKIMKKLHPPAKVICLSMHDTPQYAKKMMNEGACGYITKTSHFSEISNAIRDCLAGKNYLCQQIKNKLVEMMINEEEQPNDRLTEKEIQIIEYIRNGLSSKEISQEMELAVKTIEAHRHNILKKLNLKNSASLMHYIHSNWIQ